MADAGDLKSPTPSGCAGSSPASGTINRLHKSNNVSILNPLNKGFKIVFEIKRRQNIVFCIRETFKF